MNERMNELKDRRILVSQLYLKVLRLQNAMTTIGVKNLQMTTRSAMSLFANQHVRFEGEFGELLTLFGELLLQRRVLRVQSKVLLLQ